MCFTAAVVVVVALEGFVLLNLVHMGCFRCRGLAEGVGACAFGLLRR